MTHMKFKLYDIIKLRQHMKQNKLDQASKKIENGHSGWKELSVRIE